MEGERPHACPRNPLTLCLITDRRRLLQRLGANPEHWQGHLFAQIRGAVAGGVSVVQIRESDVNTREYVRFIRECVALAGTTCRVIVNDRLDVALVSGAHGVHLRENSIGILEARHLAHSDLIVGRSIHDARTAAAARTADYLIAGSVFETASKPGQPPSLGLNGLRAVVKAAGTCPVWAVGGITEEAVTAVKAAGVEGIAAIGAFFPSQASTDVAGEVRKKTEALRFSLERCG